MKKIIILSILSSMLFSSNTFAREEAPAEYDHYKGKKAESLEQAVTLFSEYNAKVAAILENGEPSYKDMHKVHELTYTIENALAKINSEMGALALQLEKLHKASENAKANETLKEGSQYLETAKKIIE